MLPKLGLDGDQALVRGHPPPGTLTGRRSSPRPGGAGWRGGRGARRVRQEMLLIGEMHADCTRRPLMCAGRRGPAERASPPACAPLRPLPWERSRPAPRTRDIDGERAGGRGSLSVSKVRQLSRSPLRLSPKPLGLPAPPCPGAGEGRAPPRRARCPLFPRAAAASSRPNTCTHINIVSVRMTFGWLCPRPFSFSSSANKD